MTTTGWRRGAGAAVGEADGAAFAAFVKGANRGGAALGRPLSVVAALTAGLEDVIPGAGGAPGAPGPALRRFGRGGAASGGGGDDAGPEDDNNGFLVLPGRDGRPLDGHWGGLLGGRYCFRRLIGVGTFAQIIEAEDTLSHAEPRKRVALKVTRAGMQGVGMQESQLLSFLSRCPGFHGANIVQAHAGFALGEHWCVVVRRWPGPPARLPAVGARCCRCRCPPLTFLCGQVHGHGAAPGLPPRLDAADSALLAPHVVHAQADHAAPPFAVLPVVPGRHPCRHPPGKCESCPSPPPLRHGRAREAPDTAGGNRCCCATFRQASEATGERRP
jgi:hypothetical protein